MMKHNYESKQYPHIAGKSPNEIIDIFRRYNFVDDHGHRLEMCLDFIDLVNAKSQQHQDG
ncbi:MULTISPECIES: hypothetical protein [Escherichia]|uniref:hypothetical protein n=1 Tax=Escherichia TaxID=561 RepID=UPI000CF7900F|nr:MULTISPECIES: hypothetical protein [Escherichia]UMR71076.1 hypothetical protein AOY94_11995 [Escherichia coli]